MGGPAAEGGSDVITPAHFGSPPSRGNAYASYPLSEIPADFASLLEFFLPFVLRYTPGKGILGSCVMLMQNVFKK